MRAHHPIAAGQCALEALCNFYISQQLKRATTRHRLGIDAFQPAASLNARSTAFMRV
jgi:hypothetical protein